MRFKRMMACLVAVSLVFSCMATNAFADDNADAVGPNTSQGTGETPEDDEALKAKQDEENSVQQSDDQNSDDQTGGGGTNIGGEIVPPGPSGGDQADGTDDNNTNPDGNTTTGGDQADGTDDNNTNPDGNTTSGGNSGGDTSGGGDSDGGNSGGDTSQSATLGGNKEDQTSGGASGGGSSQSATLGGTKEDQTSGGDTSLSGGGDLGASGNVTSASTSSPDAHSEIAEAIANGTWGAEYTTCKKCGKHDWWKMPDGTFKCKDCGFTTTGVKETSNVTVWPSGYDSRTVIFIYTSRKELESSSKGTVNDSQLIKITPEATLSLNPVQAMADKRELAYLNSVRKYQLDIAAREQKYLESVQQQQQAAIQFENAHTEMMLTVAAQLQQEAEKREAAYLTAAMTAAGQAQQEAEKGPVEERETLFGYFTQIDTETLQIILN